MTVDRMGRWALSVEGATCTRLPRRVSRPRPHGAGGLSPAWRPHRHRLPGQLGWRDLRAQEKLIKTPEHLSVPDAMLSDRAAVHRWLAEDSEAFAILAEQRRQAAEAYRETVIFRTSAN